MELKLKYSGIAIDLTGDDVQSFPSVLVVALLEEAVASLAESIAAIERDDIEARCDATTQAIDAVSELRGALDLEQGGEIASTLNRLYAFIVAQIPMVNVLNDAEIAQELIALIAPMHAAWVELDSRIRGNVADAEQLEEALIAAASTRRFPRPVLVR